MKRFFFVLFILFFRLAVAQEVIDFPNVGKVTLYEPAHPPASNVVIFVSGDDGWKSGVIHMAHTLTDQNALVIGVDVVHFIQEMDKKKDDCNYPAGHFENLSKFVQKKEGINEYKPPILIGYSSGATMVYLAMAQAPPNTFSGAISLGFCPDLWTIKPMCKGVGLESHPKSNGHGFYYDPVPEIQNPWIALQGGVDRICNAQSTADFINQIPTAKVISLPKVGHGYSVEKNWLPQFMDAYLQIVKVEEKAEAPPLPHLSDLPLKELPAKGEPKDTLAVIVSGDGGWASIDREIGEYLADHGISVVGLNSVKYLWNEKKPEVMSKDLDRILTYYLTTWKKSSATVIGFSIGADVLPFMVEKLPASTADKISSLVLLAPSTKTYFEVRLTGYWPWGKSSGTAILPVLSKITKPPILCVYGDDEGDSLCAEIKASKTPQPNVMLEMIKGGHHFTGDYKSVAELITKKLDL